LPRTALFCNNGLNPSADRRASGCSKGHRLDARPTDAEQEQRF
jgi:hypothetical protein